MTHPYLGMGDQTNNKYLRLRLQHVPKRVWHLLVVQRLWWERWYVTLSIVLFWVPLTIHLSCPYEKPLRTCFYVNSVLLDQRNIEIDFEQNTIRKTFKMECGLVILLQNKPTSFKFITDLKLEPIIVLKQVHTPLSKASIAI